ncbi:H-NS family nucleoid-associated regulatory protein [Bradyrhizobium sp.]|uniref:H-NS family nucleoid-associated regulatory protein n=1 Tax=Bradyrhizobium sp. TaxID=376 RepID=UPI0027343950|nr:hypothetical protein [Bradyrhizobium sp.]MDP3078654.1 hypothetical protein [Bradyrhizobium sp.]
MAKPQSSINAEWAAAFSSMNLIEQDLLLDELTAIHNTGKERRRQELRSELGSLTDRPMKTKPKPAGKPKYRSLTNPNLVWGGRGALASWLKAEMAETGKPLEAFKVT